MVTDLLDVEIDTLVGDLRPVSLPTYPVSITEPNVPLTLITDQASDLFVAQSGLLAQRPAPDHHTHFRPIKPTTSLPPAADG